MWSLSGSVARLETAELQLRFDLRHPHRGLSNVQARSAPQTLVAMPFWHLFQVHLPGSDATPSTVLESYVRGSDLVVNYGPTAAGEIQSQVYWRFIQSAFVEATGIEVIVSVQTERLDSEPSSALQAVSRPTNCGDSTTREKWNVVTWVPPPLRISAWKAPKVRFYCVCRQAG